MEGRGGRDDRGAWESIEELVIGAEAEKTLAESIRAKMLEFEKEREAYIEAAKQLLLPAITPEGVEQGPYLHSTKSARGREVSRYRHDSPSGDLGQIRRGASNDEGKENHHDNSIINNTIDNDNNTPKSALGRGWRQRRLSLLREAREERRASGEDVRILQHRKADAAVRLQAERLSNLEQGLELGVLRLERLLDRERILELLRLTDPHRPAVASLAALGQGEEEGDGVEEVSEALIERLEERATEAEDRVRAETAKLESSISTRLEQRARREERTRQEGASSRDEIVGLQTVLRDKEDRLARTVVDYLELRHAMLRAQRVSSEGREEAARTRIVREEEMVKCKNKVEEQRRDTEDSVRRTCEAVASELGRQIQLRQDETCMLREQRAEAEELFEERATQMERLVEEWKSKYGALRRRFALETEGFRRDADEIGRRFERIRAGPPGGRPPISSRSGSSARNAVERAIRGGNQ